MRCVLITALLLSACAQQARPTLKDIYCMTEAELIELPERDIRRVVEAYQFGQEHGVQCPASAYLPNAER
jgi:hypothetical protein